MKYISRLLTGVLLWVTLSNTFEQVAAHSFLIKPRGDFKSFKKPECRLGGPPHAPNDTCPGPCISKNKWQYDVNTPINHYRRGQKVSMVWGRNNHVGGFVRFSLVRKEQRMNAKEHKRMAFRYACFESDKHLCTLPNCGTDTWLYKTDVEIPTTHPDGDYVLSWAWFGGVSRGISYFGDYYSCIYVRIRGGPLTKTYRPVFHGGEKLSDSSTCISAVNRLGICVREPCLGRKGKKMVPSQFSSNDKKQGPQPIKQSWMVPSTTTKSRQLPAAVPSKTPKPSKKPVSALNPKATRKPKYQTKAKPSKKPKPSKRSEPSKNPRKNEKNKNKKTSVVVSVKGLEVLNAQTGSVIGKISSRSTKTRSPTLVSPKVKKIAIRAITEGDENAIGSITFVLNGKKTKTEKKKPFSAWGDRQGVFGAWPKPKFDSWLKMKVVIRARNGTLIGQKMFWIRLERSM